jgi:HK97 family phage portal protein
VLVIGFLRAALNRLTSSGTEQSSVGRYFLGTRTPAGTFVNHDRSLQNATVWACVQYLTKAVAQLPWRVVRESNNGDTERVTSSPVDTMLNQRPNPEMGAFTWRQAMLGHALLRGNGYAEIERDNAGRALFLWPIHPSRVSPSRDANGMVYYEVWNGIADCVDLSASDMFHLKGFGDGPVGHNVVEYAAQSIGWAQATELFGAMFFGEGMNPSGVIEMEKSLNADGLKILKEELKKFRGAGGEKTFFLDKGMKWTPVSRAPNEAQFIETRQHQIEEIRRWFGVPPHKVMHLARAAFSNIEHQSIEVVVDSVVPWVKAFEREANDKLFGQNRTNLLTKMNLNGLPRGNSRARTGLYKSLFMVGAASPNMIPRLENMNTIGPDGDKHFVPVNMVPIELAGQTIVPQPASNGPAGIGLGEQTPKGRAADGHELLHEGQGSLGRGGLYP